VRKEETDVEFMEAFRKGEERAYDRLFREYYAPLCFFAFRMLHDENLAEDIVQECFINLWNRRKGLNHIQSIRSYLYTAVRYRCVDHYRSGRPDMDALPDELTQADPASDAEAMMIMTETVKNLYEQLEQLPARMREVIKLYYLEGKTYKEIGGILQTDPETVRNQRFKALKFIRKIFIPG